MLETINKNPHKNTNELAAILNKPNKTIERWISKLKKEGKIEFTGSKKTGGYVVKKKSN